MQRCNKDIAQCCCGRPSDGCFSPNWSTPLGPSVVDNPVPLANGMNIPILGVLRGYRRYYTRCVYLNQGEIPDPMLPSFLQVSDAFFDFAYYPETRRFDVVSYPESTLVFPEGIRYETLGDTTRVYPTDSDDYYIEFVYTLDDYDGERYRGHYDVMIHGYNEPEAQGLHLDFEVQARFRKAPGTITMGAPFITVSRSHVFLSPANGNIQDINLESNLEWYFNFNK